jgi:hypothetical protein
MTKVTVEVRSGAARFRVGVEARNLQEALTLARAIDGSPTKPVRLASPQEHQDGLFATAPLGPLKARSDLASKVAA